MLVTEVKKISDRKRKILLEDGLSFVLYRDEIKKLGIREMEDLPQETIHQILEEILKKRSRLRCLNLLQSSDRTVGELRKKLLGDGYPEETVEQALAYAASFHYTDDKRYAQNYVRQMAEKKSRRQIEAELFRRGVDRDTVRAALLEAYEQNRELEAQAILKAARKKGVDPATAGSKELAGLFRSLARKGFEPDAIRAVLFPDGMVPESYHSRPLPHRP